MEYYIKKTSEYVYIRREGRLELQHVRRIMARGRIFDHTVCIVRDFDLWYADCRAEEIKAILESENV